jgi:zinc finger protein
MSFECPHCGEANTEVQSAAEIQPYGQKITLKVGNRDDADRQVIRSRHCTVSIPEIQLEMPAFSGGAVLTTVEGLLTRAAEDLEMDQDRREEAQAAAIAKVIHG